MVMLYVVQKIQHIWYVVQKNNTPGGSVGLMRRVPPTQRVVSFCADVKSDAVVGVAFIGPNPSDSGALKDFRCTRICTRPPPFEHLLGISLVHWKSYPGVISSISKVVVWMR